MSNKGNIGYAKFIVICLVVVMLTIPLRFVLKNVVYERMGICKPWMEYFMGGDAELSNALEKTISDSENEEQEVEIDWEAQYPFPADDYEIAVKTSDICCNELKSGVDRYEDFIHSVEEKIKYYCEDGLFFYNAAVDLVSKLENEVGIGVFAGGDVLQMNNGYLAYTAMELTDDEICDIADQVADFNEFLSGQDIPFLYANAGSKVCPYDRQISYGEEYTNENGTALMDALRARGVDTLDFREEMQTDGLDWYDSYYKTDHHWKTETGLWAAGKLAKKLNEYAGMHFDLSIFQKENYRLDTFENVFLGALGRAVTLENAQLEDYTRILPAFETKFLLQIPTRSVDLLGSYDQVLFDEKRLERILSYSDDDYMNQPGAYDCTRARNDALVHIRNLNATDNVDKKILLLQDSFSWYSTSFLACDVGAVDTIHPSEFTGSLRSYVEQTRPDVVVLMYCERNIWPVDLATHKSTFDLR